MSQCSKLVASLLIIAALGGCASGVTRMDGPTTTGAGAGPAVLADRTVKNVTLSLTDEAKKLVADNVKFDSEQLRSTVERALIAQGLVKPESSQTMEIQLTSFRARSNVTAVLFGFMAGNDNVEGIVTVKDGAGAVLKRAKINASYALGGLAGGMDGTRMGWLYEEFAKLTIAELAPAAEAAAAKK
jgi:hypothetical protein